MKEPATCKSCGAAISPRRAARLRVLIVTDASVQKRYLRRRVLGTYCAACAITAPLPTEAEQWFPDRSKRACEVICRSIRSAMQSRPKTDSRRRRNMVWPMLYGFYHLAWAGLRDGPAPPLPMPCVPSRDEQQKLYEGFKKKAALKSRREARARRYLCACGEWFTYAKYFPHKRACAIAQLKRGNLQLALEFERLVHIRRVKLRQARARRERERDASESS